MHSHLMPQRSGISIRYIRELADFVSELGISLPELLRSSGVPESLLSDTDATISRFACHRVLANAAKLCPRSFALRLGHRMRSGHHGFLGHAMMCARTLGESLNALERFAGTRGIPASYRIREHGDGAVLLFDLTTPVGHLRTHYLEWALMTALSPSLHDCAAREAGPTRVCLDYPEPGYREVYDELIPCPVDFDAEENAVFFTARALHTPLLNSNEAIREFCERRCELILADLETGGELSGRVRSRLLAGLPPFPTAEATAESLHISSRALRRQLHAEGTSFRRLVRQVREQLACRYLRERELTVEEVARLLGYAETAPFSRAFRSWTGQSPSDFRGS
jgi:AraC-like DNA-binding protein